MERFRNIVGYKYKVTYTSKFKTQIKKLKKQGKDFDKLKGIIEKLASNITLEDKYRDHQLTNNKFFKDCRECHIEPDWLLVYKYENDILELLLVETGSHSEVLQK